MKYRKVIEIPSAFLSSKRNRKRKNRKTIKMILLVCITLAVFLVFPSVINWIVTYNGDKFSFLVPENGISKDNQWVGFLASYSGSIIGGIISGVLTLGGVLWTLRKGDSDEEIKSYPSKRKAIIALHNQLEILRGRMEGYLYCKWSENPDLVVPLKAAVDIYKEELETLTKFAFDINGYTLLSVLDFGDSVSKLADEIDSGKIASGSKAEIQEVFLGFKLSCTVIQASIVKENQEYLDKMADIILSRKV